MTPQPLVRRVKIFYRDSEVHTNLSWVFQGKEGPTSEDKLLLAVNFARGECSAVVLVPMMSALSNYDFRSSLSSHTCPSCHPHRTTVGQWVQITWRTQGQ